MSGTTPICTDTARLLSPSNTQTNRYTLNSSLIWNFTGTNLVQFSYAWDHDNVKQTGEYSLLQPDGYLHSIWGGLPGYGTPIYAADGSIFEKRNRKTVAELDQFSLEYIGKYFDNSVRFDIGIRHPYLSRNLKQLCYTSPPANVYCTDNASIAASQNAAFAPFTIETNYNKLLPNVGATWNIDGPHSVFIDYTSALNAPVNDDLYSIASVGFGTSVYAVGLDNVKPETSQTFEGGYRYQIPLINATADVYYEEDNNHIVTSFDQSTNDSIDQNVGSVDYHGFEGILGSTLIENLTLIESVAYNHSEYMSDIPYSATLVVPTKGKVAADTPLWTLAERVAYKFENFAFGVQWKFVDSRFVSLVDDLRVPSYKTFDGDIRWDIGNEGVGWIYPGTYLQFNILNIFDERHIGSVNVSDTNNASLQYYSQPYGYQGAPRTVQVSLRATF